MQAKFLADAAKLPKRTPVPMTSRRGTWSVDSRNGRISGGWTIGPLDHWTIGPFPYACPFWFWTIGPHFGRLWGSTQCPFGPELVGPKQSNSLSERRFHRHHLHNGYSWICMDLLVYRVEACGGEQTRHSPIFMEVEQPLESLEDDVSTRRE